jgi:hypothetical protein
MMGYWNIELNYSLKNASFINIIPIIQHSFFS